MANNDLESVSLSSSVNKTIAGVHKTVSSEIKKSTGVVYVENLNIY